jgi:predicted membrane channel-forming protein YqfA (hemolysin III family)
MPAPPDPSYRKLAGIGLILLLIVVWATFVASLAQVVGRWPILVQSAFYLAMGLIWIIPLKPLVRWIQTGSWRAATPGRK